MPETLTEYSSGPAPDSHRLPFSSPRTRRVEPVKECRISFECRFDQPLRCNCSSSQLRGRVMGCRREGQMKGRESGMPDDSCWESFFNPRCILERMDCAGSCGDVVEFGCGYGTFTIPGAELVTGRYWPSTSSREWWPRPSGRRPRPCCRTSRLKFVTSLRRGAGGRVRRRGEQMGDGNPTSMGEQQVLQVVVGRKGGRT